MTEIVEVRRHSLRGEGKSLSEQGAALAERAKATLLGNYQACYTSPKRRARETLEAFGFDEYKTVEEFSTFPKAIDDYADHVQALQGRTGCSRLEAYLAIPATHLVVEEFGKTFFAKVCELAEALGAGRNALVVSHGGSIEAAVLAAMPDWTLEDIGGELAECEAALFLFEDQMFRRVDFLRLDGEGEGD
jgi:broad specificity phosphatase PhoE